METTNLYRVAPVRRVLTREIDRAWVVARKAQTLWEAHEALMAVRPVPEADRSVWVSYYLRSAEIYREVAELDPGHHGHAMYWAEREKAKAERLTGQADSSAESSDRRRKGRKGATSDGLRVMPARLDEALTALSAARPSAAAGQAVWLDYHRLAAAVFADVAEVDRAHHHEALAHAALERRNVARISGQIEDEADAVSTSDCARL